jgi:hypothetical protein
MTRVNTQTNSPEAYINGAWSPIQSTQSGQFAGLRNILINGNFIVNQRGYVSGTAVGAANTYTLDRWKVLVSGQSVAFAASGNGNQVTAPAGGLQQPIQDLNVGGGVYTLSWTGTATAQVNGAAVANGGQVTLPANTQATVTFFSGTVSQAQLEPGYVATPFEQLNVSLVSLFCNLYYQRVASTATPLSPPTTGDGNLKATIPFFVPMRTIPTVNIGSGGGGGATVDFINSVSFGVNKTPSATYTFIASWDAVAEL